MRSGDAWNEVAYADDPEFRGCCKLALAMLCEAIADVRAGDLDALAFASSGGFDLWARILGIAPRLPNCTWTT